VRLDASGNGRFPMAIGADRRGPAFWGASELVVPTQVANHARELRASGNDGGAFVRRASRTGNFLSGTWFEGPGASGRPGVSGRGRGCVRRRIRKRVQRELLCGDPVAHSEWQN